jgi:hypothetical protein
MFKRGWARRSLNRGCCAAIAAAALCLVPGVASAATNVTDLGPVATSPSEPLVVNDLGQVVFRTGVWANGSLSTPPVPASAGGVPVTITLQSINDSGVAVGNMNVSAYAGDGYTPGNLVGYWWNTLTGATGTSAIPSTPSCLGDVSLYDVDDQGEASGAAATCSTNEGVFAGSFGVSPPELDADASVIYAINQGYEFLRSTSDDEELIVNRSTNADSVLPDGLYPGDNDADGNGSQSTVSGNYLGANGSVVGELHGGQGAEAVPVIGLPGAASLTDLQTPTDGPSGLPEGTAYAINSAGEIVGSDSDGAALWTSYTVAPEDLNKGLPGGSGWSLNYAYDISANGYVIGVGTLNGVAHYFKVQTGTPVSGTVNDEKCSDESCSQTGLAGATIVMTGTATDGSPVTVSTDTADDGTWDVAVPAGTYTVGPSHDGTTIDGAGFDPQSQSQTVGTTPVTGVDFQGCVLDPGGSSASGSVADAASAGSARAHLAGEATAGGNPDVSLCKSVYTFKFSAKIPQSIIADPALDAHYNSNADPNRAGYKADYEPWLGLLHSGSVVRRVLAVAPEFPECMNNAQVEAYTKGHVGVEWYSYIEGGSLGTVTVPVVWNQNTQGVHVEAAPVLRYGTLTRVFKYKLGFLDKDVTGSCEEREKVPIFATAAGGADKTPGKMDSNQFTIITSWQFPFDVPGIKIDPESTLVNKLFGEVCKTCKEVYENYEKLSEFSKWPIDFLLSYAIGTGEVKAVLKAPDAATAFFKASKLLPGVLSALKAAGEVAEFRHKLSTAQELDEAIYKSGLASVSYLAGALGDGDDHYPIMAAVIRGDFHSNTQPWALPDGKKIPAGTTLAVSVKSTEFPTISMKVTRNAFAATASSGPSTGKVFTGALPWDRVSGNATVSNPSFGSNPLNTIARTKNHRYASGKDAVENLVEDTSQTPAVSRAVKTGDLDSSASIFNDEQDLSPEPVCEPDVQNISSKPASDDTICWTFDDQRP